MKKAKLEDYSQALATLFGLIMAFYFIVLWLIVSLVEWNFSISAFDVGAFCALTSAAVLLGFIKGKSDAIPDGPSAPSQKVIHEFIPSP